MEQEKKQSVAKSVLNFFLFANSAHKTEHVIFKNFAFVNLKKKPSQRKVIEEKGKLSKQRVIET